MMKCHQCGTELADGTKFCPNCGAKVDPRNSNITEASKESVPTAVPEREKSKGETFKEKVLAGWHSLDLFCKVATVGIGIATLLLLIALLSHTGVPILFSIFQIVLLVVAMLMHQGIITSPNSWVPYLLLVMALIFTVSNLASYSAKGPKEDTIDEPVQEIQAPQTSSSVSENQTDVSSKDESISPTETVTEETEVPETEESTQATALVQEETPDVSETEEEDLVEDSAPVQAEETEPSSIEEEEVNPPVSSLQEDESEVPNSASGYKHDDFQDVQASLSEAGFTNIQTEILYDIIWGWTSEGEVDSVSIDGDSSFDEGAVFKKDAEIIITYHMKAEDDPTKATEEETKPSEETESKLSEEAEPSEAEPETVSYSTNTKDTVKNGNAGIYAYKNRGAATSIYYIIDFDEGYVYCFIDGNGDSTCDRIKIESGNLNDVLIITYHDGDSSWSEGLHFKWRNQPDHLILEDKNHDEYDYYTTDLDKAIRIRDSREIYDY